MKRTLAALLAAVTARLAGRLLTGLRRVGGDDTVTVVIGYQSKTINTVTAGTLLRARASSRSELADVSKTSGKTYKVQVAGLRHRRARSPPRCSPGRSTSARWATTRC